MPKGKPIKIIDYFRGRLAFNLKHFVAILLCIFVYNSLTAQTDNSFFTQKETFAKTSPKKLTLRLAHIGHFQNHEFNSNLQHGYTLPGFQLIPTMAYQLDSQLLIFAGASLQRLYGDAQWFQVEPMLTLSYFTKWGRFNFGNLQGSLDHQLPETMMGYGQVLQNRQETGLQFLGNTRNTSYDLWLDWQKAIRPDDPFKERFVAGFSGNWKAINNKHLQLAIPAYLSIFHSGGEIDLSTGINATQYNFNTGLSCTLGKIKAGILFDFYEDESAQSIDTFRDGWGQRAYLQYTGKVLQSELGYWDAHQFQAPQGELMYQSLSRKEMGRSYFFRKMYWTRWSLRKSFNPQAEALFRCGTWYDVHQNTLDFSVEIYVKWNLDIKLN